MKRIVYDVPRWSCYLHRSARGMNRADPTDSPELQVSDELFERLFAGDVEAIPDGERYALLAEWASRIHDTVSQLPAFERLAQECRGRADESAIAVEALMAEIKADDQDDVLRRTARLACGKASAAVEQLRDAMEGLEHVAFGPVPGVGTSQQGTSGDGGNARSLAARLRDSARLREIAKLAGRFKRIAGAKRRSRVRHGADEIVDVETGADLGRLLPLELALLVHPSTKLLAMRNLLERSCLQYRLEGTETLGKGPLVVAIDKSGSMEGERDIWATAVALALLDVAQAEKRPFGLLAFDANVKFESIVLPGEALPGTALFVPADGGTDIDKVVRRGLEIIEQRPGAMKQADVVLITDGGSNSENAGELRERAATLGVTILGVAIDVEPSRLEPWCDQVITASDMSRVDDKSAEALFTLGGR
jgi:uncharacterized protein with von Willebrand factor type A (vWA) domain